MLIVSKFKDYYDSVGPQFGIDKSIVYQRVTSTPISNKKNVSILSRFKRTWPWNNRMDLHFPPTPGYQTVDAWYIIGFCGKIHICCLVEKSKKFGYEPIIKEVYYKTQLQKLFATQEDEKYRKTLKLIETHEEVDISGVFVNYKTPIFLEQLSSSANQTPFTVNPRLSDYGFVKTKDPFSAFQEIQQYISGVLGVDLIKIPEPSDKIKIVAAGFDIVTSFRKDKQS